MMNHNKELMNHSRDLLNNAPKLKEMTEKVLYEDIWQRAELSKRERSIITLSVLASLGRLEQLPFHLGLAKTNGIIEEELVELFTHLAFYAGWPAAVSALERVRTR
ncbi:carboxymuconolactone decarboxylase family protein [Vibrio profundum]|uniref:carboxymuconolactone decarboxylase family protein n=1 Tax=Vibrio profundum TaxID=2910247 RepID=UPI003D0F4D81